MELSLKQLVSMRKTVFVGGLLQVGISVGVATLISKFFGIPWNQAIFIGFLFSLSSTAIVLKILQDRNEISAPHGRIILGILIFQDIIVIPMMLVTPMLAGHSANLWMTLLWLLLKSSLVIFITYISARYFVPRLMNLIVRTKSKELFLLTTITLCFAIAFLTAEAGLSLAFGAFLAGLIISESEYSHQATSTILPFRELFTSIFFISIGMLLNLNFFAANFLVVLILVAVVFLLKGTIVAISTAFLKYPPRTVLLTGLSLFQIGEFAFILSKVGVQYNLVSSEMNQYFLSISIVTMLFTPFVILYSEKITALIVRPRLAMKWSKKYGKVKKKSLSKLENHLVIIGYGINGRNVAKAASYVNIPYVILELNADTVESEKAKGESIIFGDATHEYMLKSLKLNKSRVVVVAISDPKATKTIVSNIRNISQSTYIVVRTRYVKEVDELTKLGADEVIPEEFETSIAIFLKVLHNYLIPMDELENIINSIRLDNYEIFNSQSKILKTITSTQIPDFNITCIKLLVDSGAVVGKTIAEAKIRSKFNVNVLAISRGSKILSNITPDEKLMQNDLVYISGDQEHIENFHKVIS